MKVFNKIIISRTDNIGDVVLTLPLAGILKKYFPNLHIIFLGKLYTRNIIFLSKYVDEFLDWDALSKLPDNEKIEKFKELNADAIIHVFPNKKIGEIAKKAKIPYRIGTAGRIHHRFTCNKLVYFSRRKSNLHEAELNQELLKGLGITSIVPKERIHKFYGFEVPQKGFDILDKKKINVIIHPKSKGSAREWGLDNFNKLVELLPEKKFKIFMTGVAEDKELVKGSVLDKNPRVHNVMGEFSFADFIAFIASADVMVAASTGPLHIAAALEKIAIGLFAPMRPIHPGRWAPLGSKASYLVLDKECNDCKKSLRCECIESITSEAVYKRILEMV